ncbi:hypothetical protein M8C21_020359 [Ambrosia artemisiifolia]|uniref:Uncharacterized protein n=1 Tax=Ambrosia artemisiifolia TaxID=4212 RepID=A0AAD5GMK4_AMBAR|nr:hypothetical protein M8C21_020359 [Ambrosia artemisiifolia]
MRVLSWYLRMLDVRPISTKSISAGLIYGAADLTSQSMTIGAFSSLDLIRTLRMAMFGLLFLGPAQHAWFNFLGRILPKRDMTTTFKKLIVGQIFYGPSCTAVFFTYNAFLQGESGNEITLRLRRDLLPTLTGGLMYWPVCDFFTYKIIPVHLQVALTAKSSGGWNFEIYMRIKAGKSGYCRMEVFMNFVDHTLCIVYHSSSGYLTKIPMMVFVNDKRMRYRLGYNSY